MSNCLICGSIVDSFMSFGQMPIANGFLSEKQFENEFFFELKVGFCQNCAMVQLTELVDREKMFHENYAFYSSTSSRMANHFKQFAEDVITNYLPVVDPFVVEIGSNDGILLKNFSNKGMRHLGIEPSSNVAQVAVAAGINTISAFFDEALAEKLVSRYGQADAFFGANVMCHIPYMHSILKGIKILLKPTGVVIFEDPYLGDIVAKTSYDQIYDEHAFYFSLASVDYMFKQYEMEVFDVIHQNTHGGSMRYIIGHKGKHAISLSVENQITAENRLGLRLSETYVEFKANIENSRNELIRLLKKLKKEGKRVVGYGATSKSTTVANYCGITDDLVEHISDTTPIKQGKYSPGVHIPVKPYDEFVKEYPDYALLFAWNHAEEIISKEKRFLAAGGRFILYVPSVHSIGAEAQ